MRCYRIADSRFPLFDPTGARLHGGRWNSPGYGLIYAAETYAGAMLEILVHANLSRVPRTQAFIMIEIPEQITIERLKPADLPDWQLPNQAASQSFGNQWLTECRSAVTMVPSLVTQGQEHNVLINPAHPDFSRITYTEPQSVIWDERLFRQT